MELVGLEEQLLGEIPWETPCHLLIYPLLISFRKEVAYYNRVNMSRVVGCIWCVRFQFL